MKKPDFNQMVNDLLKFSTQTELASDTGVDQSLISKLKNGNPCEGITYKNATALIEAHKKIRRKLKQTQGEANDLQ